MEVTGDNFVGRGNVGEWDIVLFSPSHRSIQSGTVWPHVGCVATVVIGNNRLDAAIEERDDREVLQVESTIVESKDRSVGINEVTARELSIRGVFIRIVHLPLIDDDEDESTFAVNNPLLRRPWYSALTSVNSPLMYLSKSPATIEMADMATFMKGDLFGFLSQANMPA